MPVENTRQVTLSYDLLLNEDSMVDGDYDTNQSAELEYVSTDGKYKGTYTFDVPVVHYTDTTDISVTKVWEDEYDKDGVRPDSITVDLLANGEKASSITISAKDEWKGSFTGLAKTENGESIEYTVEETAVDGYTASYEGDADKGFTITNTHTAKKDVPPGTPGDPKTGDDSGLGHWVGLMILAAAGLTAAMLTKRKANI